MTKTKEYDVIDKYGRIIRRAGDGVTADGEGIRVHMTVMDAQNPALVAAAALAGSIRRVEAFDMSQHPQSSRYGTKDANAEDARVARDQRMGDAWKNPGPAVLQADLDRRKAVDVPTVNDMSSLEA